MPVKVFSKGFLGVEMKLLVLLSLLFGYLTPTVANSATHRFLFRITDYKVHYEYGSIESWQEYNPGKVSPLQYYVDRLAHLVASNRLRRGFVQVHESRGVYCWIEGMTCPDPEDAPFELWGGGYDLSQDRFQINNGKDQLSVDLLKGGKFSLTEEQYDRIHGYTDFEAIGVVERARAVVPLPFSAALLPVGFVGLGLLRHRQRRRIAAAA
jgi:hypothetical protein